MPGSSRFLRAVIASLLVTGLVIACTPTGVKNMVTIGEKTHLCVVFNGLAKAYFTPIADKLTRLEFNGSRFEGTELLLLLLSPHQQCSCDG